MRQGCGLAKPFPPAPLWWRCSQIQMPQKDTAQRLFKIALFRLAGSHGLDHVYRVTHTPLGKASPTSPDSIAEVRPEV